MLVIVDILAFGPEKRVDALIFDPVMVVANMFVPVNVSIIAPGPENRVPAYIFEPVMVVILAIEPENVPA